MSKALEILKESVEQRNEERKHILDEISFREGQVAKCRERLDLIEQSIDSLNLTIGTLIKLSQDE